MSSPNYRYWEVPGSSHQPLDSNDAEHDLLSLGLGAPFADCPFPYQGPGGPAGIDPVLRSAVVHLDAWIRTGQAPPDGPLIDMVPSAASPTTGVIQRDQYGNALGGIRLPQQEVPTGRNTPSTACFTPLFPQWDAFDGGADPAVDPADAVNATEPASAKAVYGDHLTYALRFIVAARQVENAGFILPADALKLMGDAVFSDIAT